MNPFITILAILALLALVLFTTLKSAQVECRVCIQYEGRSECASAAAPSAGEAQKSATTAACALLASGRAASLECERMPPASLDCR